jgi:glycosyltransferase involved in cell wall biosynthesis
MGKRIAVVGWAGDSGVGRELIDACRNLPIMAAFVLENPSKPTRRDLLHVPNFVSMGGGESDMESFLNGYKPDTILTWEVPGSWKYPAIWKRRGIKWIHMVHWDWFAPQYMDLWRSAQLLSPNKMCQNELLALELPSTYLPVPVDTKRLKFKLRKKADTFISVYGFGGQDNRRSLHEVFAAWRMLKSETPLLIFAQKDPPELEGLEPVPGAQISVGNVPEPADLYTIGDIAVQPSRYEGVGVSMVEAQATGIPVIAINAPPMNEIVRDLLVPVDRVIDIQIMGKSLPSFVPSPGGLAALVGSIRGTDISELSLGAREMVEKKFSWTALREQWIQILRS